MRIGQQQLRMLIMSASPTSILVTPDKVSASLVARGLLASDERGGCTITPAGLRILADEMEAGRIPAALDAMRRDAKAWRERRDKASTARSAA